MWAEGLTRRHRMAHRRQHDFCTLSAEESLAEQWQCQLRTPSGGAFRHDQGARWPQAVAHGWTATHLQGLFCTSHPHPTSFNVPAIPLSNASAGLIQDMTLG